MCLSPRRDHLKVRQRAKLSLKPCARVRNPSCVNPCRLPVKLWPLTLVGDANEASGRNSVSFPYKEPLIRETNAVRLLSPLCVLMEGDARGSGVLPKVGVGHCGMGGRGEGDAALGQHEVAH